MSMRRPRDDYVPPVVRGRVQRHPRVIQFEQPDPGVFRGILRFLLKPYLIIPAFLLTAVVIGGLGYYWVVFSARIDNLLKGEVFTRSAGIYAAPKEIRTGQNISEDDLISHLKRAGYVDRGQQADSARGRYAADGLTLLIDPSQDANLDGARPFSKLRVQFARNGKSIASIGEVSGHGNLDKAELEPELISTLTGRERAKRKIVGFN